MVDGQDIPEMPLWLLVWMGDSRKNIRSGVQLMATLHVQNVPDDLYTRLQQLAISQNRSISA